MTDGARRAVAYIRLPESGSPPEATNTAATQRSAIEAWAARERVEVTSWQVDVGVSGSTPIAERPGLMAAYRAIREHRAGILTAANADRFSRDELVCWLIERAALTEGATIHTADGSRGPAARAEPSTPPAHGGASTAFTRGAVQLARAYNRVVASSRIRSVLAEKRARGERVGTIPYGYRLAADGIHVEPDEAELAVVTLVRELANQGHSHRAIVADLEARGVAGRTGAPLKQTQIANLLRATSVPNDPTAGGEGLVVEAPLVIAIDAAAPVGLGTVREAPVPTSASSVIANVINGTAPRAERPTPVP